MSTCHQLLAYTKQRAPNRILKPIDGTRALSRPHGTLPDPNGTVNQHREPVLATVD